MTAIGPREQANEIAYQVRDRLSFMRFLGLGLGDRVPDAKTVWLYRDALVPSGQGGGAVCALRRSSGPAGIFARGGQILDASIVPVRCPHNTREENAAIKKGEVP